MLLSVVDCCRRQGKTSREAFPHHNQARKEKEKKKKKLFASLRAAHLSAPHFMQEGLVFSPLNKLIAF